MKYMLQTSLFRPVWLDEFGQSRATKSVGAFDRFGGWFSGLVMAAGMLMSTNAHAVLIDRGCGMIYDTVLNVTWLADANHAATSGYDADGKMDWSGAMAWAAQLSYCGYGDWRLPAALPVNGVSYNNNLSYDGTTDVGYNITSLANELAYMFAVNLGNHSYYDTAGNGPQQGYGLANTGVFSNLHEYYYWSGSAVPNLQDYSWGFSFIVGGQRMYYQPSEHYAWAVRDGDVNPGPQGDGDVAPLGAPDGRIDVADYQVMLRIVLGELAASELEVYHGDLSPPGMPDGIIDIADLVRLQALVFSP